jgi:DNA-binding CsgD family transcriptional regulator
MPTRLARRLLAALERMSCGGVILDPTGRVLDLNPTARNLLRCADRCDSGHELDARESLKFLLRAGETRFATERDTWAVVAQENRRPLALYSARLSDADEPGPHTVVILIDLESLPRLDPATLQKIFGLTPAEARLAIQIAQGEMLADIAQAANISMATARKQLACVFQKTRTHRQAELVALLARVSILP